MRSVLIHNGEGGRSDNIFYTQFLTDGFDEGGLSCTHVPIEGEDTLVAHRLNKLFRSLANMF